MADSRLWLLVRTGAMFLAGNQPHQTALPQFEEVIASQPSG